MGRDAVFDAETRTIDEGDFLGGNACGTRGSKSSGSFRQHGYRESSNLPRERAFSMNLDISTLTVFKYFLTLYPSNLRTALLSCKSSKRVVIALSGYVPSNIILIVQPAHDPEFNPIERVWLHLKQGLLFTLPKNMDELRLLVKNRLSEMTKSVIASLVRRDSILDALSVASLL